MNNKILIIGAGIAGLAAATYLAKQGIAATILEARDKVGGRIRTEIFSGIPISLGAQWMHGTEGNPVKELTDQLQLRYVASSFSQIIVYDRSGNIISPESISAFYQEFNQEIEMARHYAFSLPTDISLLESLHKIINLKTKPQLYQDLFLAAAERISLYTGGSLEQLSARYWDEESHLQGNNMMMLDGYLPIAEKLAASCNIHFNSEVREINYTTDKIIVTTQNEQWITDKLILTIPLGILKNNKIRFIPELDSVKQNSIEKLAMGILNSVVMKFPAVFWPANEGIQFSASEENFSFFNNLNYFYQQPILTARISGDVAKNIEKLSDEVILERAMHQLKHFFGSNIPKPQSFMITRWGQDPYAFGSYSYIPIDASAKNYSDLAQPIENRLFFAGEATNHLYPGTIHGAYLSGLRAADESMK